MTILGHFPTDAAAETARQALLRLVHGDLTIAAATHLRRVPGPHRRTLLLLAAGALLAGLAAALALGWRWGTPAVVLAGGLALWAWRLPSHDLTMVTHDAMEDPDGCGGARMTDAPLRRWRDRWTAHYEVWQTLGGEPIWLITTTISRPAAERAAAAWEARPPARDGPSVLSDEERALLRELGEALVAEHGPEGIHFGTRIRRRAGLDPQIIEHCVTLGILGGAWLIGFVLKTVLPAHVWTWGVTVFTLGMVIMSMVWIWRAPYLDLDAWMPSWDGTEDDDD